RVPLVADIHYTPGAALLAAEHVEKVRINPGNYAAKKKFEVRDYSDAEYAEEVERAAGRFRPLVRRLREGGRALRIGTNHGSLADRILNRYGDTPRGMVESALEFLDVCEVENYYDVVFSMKASNAQVAIQAYRLVAARRGRLSVPCRCHRGGRRRGRPDQERDRDRRAARGWARRHDPGVAHRGSGQGGAGGGRARGPRGGGLGTARGAPPPRPPRARRSSTIRTATGAAPRAASGRSAVRTPCAWS